MIKNKSLRPLITIKAHQEDIMRLLKIGPVIVIALLLSAFAAYGEDTNPVLGKWEQSRPNGSKFVWRFTATTMALTIVDATEKQVEPQFKTSISYRKLERSKLGENYGIEFKKKEKGEKPGIDITATILDPNTMQLDYPGLGFFLLIRAR